MGRGGRRLAYLRDRLVNAFWMLREGRFRQMLASIALEARTRTSQVQAALGPPPELPRERSGGANPCKPAPATPRPVVARRRTRARPLAVDAARLDQCLQSALASLGRRED